MEQPSKTGLALALELTDLGCRLEAQRYRRLHPGCPEAEVEAHAQRWLFQRPGAPYGDAEGVPGTWPRRASTS